MVEKLPRNAQVELPVRIPQHLQGRRPHIIAARAVVQSRLAPLLADLAEHLEEHEVGDALGDGVDQPLFLDQEGSVVGVGAILAIGDRNRSHLSILHRNRHAQDSCRRDVPGRAEHIALEDYLGLADIGILPSFGQHPAYPAADLLGIEVLVVAESLHLVEAVQLLGPLLQGIHEALQFLVGIRHRESPPRGRRDRPRSPGGAIPAGRGARNRFPKKRPAHPARTSLSTGRRRGARTGKAP